MVRLTKAVIKGADLPVTVKTRLGWDDNSINIDEVAERLQDIGVQALSIHGRTRAQLYKGEADWSHIARVKNNPRITMPIFGNGDIDSVEKAIEYKERYGVDGIMIGRAAIGYPWIFNEIKHYAKTGEKLPVPTMHDRIEAARNHLVWAMEWKGEWTGIAETRRHYTNYFKGISHFKEYRQKLVTLDNAADLMKAFDEISTAFADYSFVWVESRKLKVERLPALAIAAVSFCWSMKQKIGAESAGRRQRQKTKNYSNNFFVTRLDAIHDATNPSKVIVKKTTTTFWIEKTTG